MTRAAMFTVANEMQPLQRPFVLPYRYTPLLEDVLLLCGDAQATTQATLQLDAALEARAVFSPLYTPEMTQGSIISAKA